jgi:tight adherence protein B
VDTQTIGILGIALTGLGIGVALAILLSDPESWLLRSWAGYEERLERESRFLFMKISGPRLARNQLMLISMMLIMILSSAAWTFLLLLPLAGLLPIAVLRRRHKKRVEKLEGQLDSWLLILANALKASPSLGEAIKSSAKIVRPPMRQELDLLLKEVHLGTPLDRAVLGMSERVGSRIMAGALATLLVGRQTGGDLPQILEDSAATLREMARLEGVVRTKTAEGKSQAYVLGGIPFILIAAIHWVDPNWLRPLAETGMGTAVIVTAALLWALAIISARKILAVDV